MSGPDTYFESAADKKMALSVADGDVSAIESLVHSGQVNPQAVGRDATSWLIISIVARQKAAMDKLLELGAMGDPRGPIAGQALYTATVIDDPYWLKRLHSAGADLNNKGGGDLLLVVAMDTRNEETLEFYLRNGADVNRPTNVGGSVALSAAMVNRFDLANRFLDLGASPWVMDKLGHTLGSVAEKAAKVPAWDHQSRMNRHRTDLLARLHAGGFPDPAPTAAEGRELKSAGRWPPSGAPEAAPRLSDR